MTAALMLFILIFTATDSVTLALVATLGYVLMRPIAAELVRRARHERVAS